MTKKDKIEWLKKVGYEVSMIDRYRIKVRRSGLIETGTVNQVYNDLHKIRYYAKTTIREDID